MWGDNDEEIYQSSLLSNTTNKYKCPECGSYNVSSQQEGGETDSWKTHKWCNECDWDIHQDRINLE